MENTVKTQSTIPKLKFKNVIGYGCGDAGGVITIYMVAMYMSRYLQVQLEVNAGILATMLMCHKVTHKNLIDSSPLFRYCLTHASCNFFVKTIDSDTSKEI